MFLGLRTVTYHSGTDLVAAKAWYSKVLDIQPYFDQPFYVGFNVGGYELGLTPDAPSAGGQSGALVYWGVKDANTALKRLLDLGAKEHSPVQDVGDGILLATVVDPFGNLLGVIENRHFSLPDA